MTRELTNWLLRWQGIGAIVTIVAMGVGALTIHGRDMQRLDSAEGTIRELRSETVTRREFELLMRSIDDLRLEVRAMRDALDRRPARSP